jgi:hypothetical protein
METESFQRLVLRIARRLNVTIAHAKAVAEIHYTPRAAR